MFRQPTRRRFLQTAASGGALLGLPPLLELTGLGQAAAEPLPDKLRYDADLEPLVRLIEETPREKCPAALAEQLRGGLPYRRLLAAVFLATIRKTNPHHAVYLVHSAHQTSLDVRPDERLLPLFWAVDNFKSQQERFPTPSMEPFTGELPAAEKAAAEFHEAMRVSQSERAERALVALARGAGAREAMQQLWQYAGRDSSLIGHRGISVTSCWRVLETIGWQHAEPVLRFVVRDLHLRGGGADVTYYPNLARVERLFDKLPAGWSKGKADRGATLELFALLRQGRHEACELAATMLSREIGAQPIWDAIHVATAELLIVHEFASGMQGRPLHGNTAVNALHFAYHAAPTPRIRMQTLLQAVGWVATFYREHLGEKALAETKPVDLAGLDAPASAAEAIEEVFALLPPRTYDRGYTLDKRGDRAELGRKVFALISANPESATPYMQAARGWLTRKAVTEAHEYKLPAALFEDYDAVSPEWRPRLLAASAHWLHGKQSSDSVVLQRARDVLQG